MIMKRYAMNIRKYILSLVILGALLLIFSGNVSAAELPLTTDHSGTVSGDLYMDAQQPTPFGSQPQNTGVTQEATFTFAPEGYTSIEYAKFYTMVYVAGTDDRECKVDVSLDGNNDGSYETILDDDYILNTASSTTGDVYWERTGTNEISRVYSDYLLSYDVTSLLQSGTVKFKVETMPGSSNMDGRIKFLALVVAYNDGDNDQIMYWVNDGHQWFNDGTSRQTTFNTSSLSSGWDNAQLNLIHTSSSDATYNFNGTSLTGGNPVPPAQYFKLNTWDVTNNLTAGTSSTLTYSKSSGSYKTPLATLKVEYDALPDLRVTNIAYNPSNSSGHQELFANEANNIRATISNTGTANAGPFTVLLTIGSYTETQSITGLNAGSTVDVTFTGYTPTSNGVINIQVEADNGQTVEESDETNNTLSTTRTVYYNGYKSKRYTAGNDIETQATWEGNLGLIYSAGNTVYNGTGWTEKTYTWTTTDLPLPPGATIVSARLYQGYTWDTTPGGTPLWTMTFNGSTVTPIATYTDRKGYGTYDYPQGLYVYDVTSQFQTTGNTMTITPQAGNNNGIYGAYLVVVYEDPNTTYKKIWINDELDMLCSYSTRSVSNEEATAYANFQGVNTNNLGNAQAIAILQSANDVGKSKFLFNGQEYTGFWNNYLSGPQIGFSQYDVTSALENGLNTAGLQSFMVSGSGDNMYATNVILIAEYLPDLVVTNIVPNNGAGNELFAHEPNQIMVTVQNQGSSPAGESILKLDVAGTEYTINVPSLGIGASTTVTITDTTIRNAGSALITATADYTNLITEANESNNILSASRNIYNNGYKGKRYTAGNDLETQATWEGNLGLIYSAGNTVYNGAGWTEKTYTWTTTDLPLPPGATIVSARLYQAYTYNQMTNDPAWTMTFNGSTVTPIATYTDRKGYGTYDYPSGLYVYDVTSQFQTTGNTMTITPEVGNNYGIYGAYLLVIYEDPNTTYKKIWINEECDMLYSGNARSVTNEEGTAYANFQGVNTANLDNAQVLNILASANDVGKSKFLFNGQEYTGFWNNYLSGPQIGFSQYDVTSALENGLNTAGLQSFMVSGSGDNLVALGSVLVTEYQEVTSTDLGVTKTFLDGNTWQPTNTMNYGDYVYALITLTNHASETATGVLISDPTPNGLEYMGTYYTSYDGGATWQYLDGTFNPASGWTVNSIGSGMNYLLAALYKVNSVGNVDNTAIIQGAVNDLTPEDNTATANLHVPGEGTADIMVEKFFRDGYWNPTSTAQIGDYVYGLVKVTNHGPDTAQEVVVTDQLPDGLSFVGHYYTSYDGGVTWNYQDGSYNQDNGEWTIGNIANQGSCWLAILYQVETDGIILNTAHARYTTNDPQTGNDDAQAHLNNQ